MTRDLPFKFVGVSPNSERAGAEENRPSDEEGLRLIKAFFRIRDPDIRSSLVQLVERMSARLDS